MVKKGYGLLVSNTDLDPRTVKEIGEDFAKKNIEKVKSKIYEI